VLGVGGLSFDSVDFYVHIVRHKSAPLVFISTIL